MKRMLTGTMGACVLIFSSGVQAAPATVKAGTLVCKGGEGVGLIVGSKKSYDCTYQPVQGPSANYTASVTKVGLDIGVTGKTTMVWTVLTAESPVKRRVLAGTYVGAAAGGSVGIGGGANVLVGGSNKSITLQPLSVQGQTGINLALGVAELKLR